MPKGSRKPKSRSSSLKRTQAQKHTEKLVQQTGRKIAAAKRSAAKTTRKIEATAKAIKREAKQIKKTGKAVKQFSQAIKKLVKNKSRKPELSLIDIERLLGEEFESLAQARRALKRETKVVTPKKGGRTGQRRVQGKKAAPVPPASTLQQLVPENTRKRIYELRELPQALEQSTMNATLEELIDDSASYDALLKPGDIWGARVGVGKQSGYTYQAFNRFADLIRYLQEYRINRRFGDVEAAKNELVEMFKIIRFKTPGKSITQADSYNGWVDRKRAERLRSKERIHAFKAKRKAERKELKDAKRERNALRQQVEEQQRRMKTLIAERKQQEEMRRLEEIGRKQAEKKLRKLEGRK